MNEKYYAAIGKDILELWVSKGIEVVEERFRPVGKGRFKWTIIARKKEEA